MKVLLLKTIEKIGLKGKIVDVSDGYAKNALLPKKYAQIATQQMIANYTAQKQKMEQKENERESAIKSLLPKLKNHEFIGTVKMGKGGEVFTSMHKDTIHQMVFEFIKKESPLFEKEDVHIETKPLKEIGAKTLSIRLGRGTKIHNATITINIQGE